MNTMKDVTDFVTTLVKWGGLNDVDSEHFIVEPDGTRTTVSINGKERQMRIPYDGMLQDMDNKSTLFTPLIEPLGHTAERRWFFASRTHAYGNLVKRCMRSIIEICTATEKDDAPPTYDQLSVAQCYNERITATLGKNHGESTPLILKELEKIDPLKLLRAQYSRRKRVIQLQTDIYDTEWLTETLKIRKKSAVLFQEMFGDIMSSEDIHEDYTYMAVQMGMPEIECFMHMMKMFAVTADKYTRPLLNVNLYPAEMDRHLEFVQEYRKKCSHLVGATIQQDKTEKDVATGRTVATPPTSSLARLPGMGGVALRPSLPGSVSHLPSGGGNNRLPGGTVSYATIAERAMVDPTFNAKVFLQGGCQMIGGGRPMIGPGVGELPVISRKTAIPKLPPRR
jgi:hypothetical protein